MRTPVMGITNTDRIFDRYTYMLLPLSPFMSITEALWDWSIVGAGHARDSEGV